VNSSFAQQYWTPSGTADLINANTGNVGIGIVPLEKLHINGAIRGNQSAGALRISTTAGYVDVGPTNSSFSHFRTNLPRFYFDKPLYVNGGYSSYDVNPLELQTNGVTKMIILNPSGNVGIGNTTPQKKLEVNTGVNDFVSFGNTISGGEYTGLHFGYLVNSNTLYRKSAMVFERLDNAARGKIHFLNNGDWSSASATLVDSKLTIDFTGNIGIGTQDPQAKLHVGGGHVIIEAPAGQQPVIYTGTGTGVGAGQQKYLSLINSPDAGSGSASGLKAGGVLISDTYSYANPGKNDLVVKGNIGIGAPVAQERLHIGEEGRVNIRVGRWASIGETYSGLATIIGSNVKASNAAVNKMEFITSTVDGGKAIKMQYNEGISFHTHLGTVTAGAEYTGHERMRIDNNGNVGIGTTTPDARLAVNGTIHTKEVRVDLDDWSDYVFATDYTLMPLSEVARYIEEHKHLPDVPSETEVKEKGVNLGEMDSILLKKIEELTLYLIEMEKRNQALQDRIETLEKE
jgi:hypothetical protein